MTARGCAPAIVLYGAILDDTRPDDRDTLVQLTAVSAGLRELGYAVQEVPLTLDLEGAAERLGRLRPAFVFNLVESVAGRDSLLPLGPMLLDTLGIPYTGNSTRALQSTTDKLLAKRLMRARGIRTPDTLDIAGESEPPGERYIVKSVTEHASFGIDAGALTTAAAAPALLVQRRRRHGGAWFAERYIDGREFNLAAIAGPSGPELLPPAEIDFAGLPPEEPRIVGYAAKWDEGSQAYAHTLRRGEFPESDQALLRELGEITLACWDLFDLAGCARVDFRVDEGGRPWVLEVNANPCLAPDAGFIAAAERAGLNFVEVIARLVHDALSRADSPPDG